MRIFKTKVFNRYAKKQKITDEKLHKAVAEIESGLVDVDYGGNLLKKRIPKEGEGKSGGHRSILAYVKGGKAFFMYGFEKGDKANIKKDEEQCYKKLAKQYIALDDTELILAKNENVLFEVNRDE